MLKDLVYLFDFFLNFAFVVKVFPNVHKELFTSKDDDQVLLKSIEVSVNECKDPITDVEIDETKQVLFLDERVLIFLQIPVVFLSG